VSGVNAAIDAVIFDYGGVISTRVLDDLGPFEDQMGYPRGSVLRLMLGDSQNHLSPDGDEGPAHDYHLLEMGLLSLDDYLAGLVRRAPEVLGCSLDFDAYVAFASAMPLLVQWPVVHRIRRLHDDGMRLALLTNNVKEFGDAWRATFPVDDLFGVVVDSSEVALRKPDPRIYELACERVGVGPTAAVFLDDNDENVAAAAALGMETVLVGRDPLATIADLDAILDRRGCSSLRSR